MFSIQDDPKSRLSPSPSSPEKDGYASPERAVSPPSIVHTPGITNGGSKPPSEVSSHSPRRMESTSPVKSEVGEFYAICLQFSSIASKPNNICQMRTLQFSPQKNHVLQHIADNFSTNVKIKIIEIKPVFQPGPLVVILIFFILISTESCI